MKNFKKVLSLALALLMVVGCMVVAPVETKAEGTYTKVTDVSTITDGGNFVLVVESAGAYYAVDSLSSGWLTATAVTIENDAITSTDAPIVAIASSESAVQITTAGGDVVCGSTSKNNIYNTPDTSIADWTVSESGTDLFKFYLVGSEEAGASRYLSYAVSSAKFRQYKESTLTDYASDYVAEFMVYEYSGTVVDPNITLDEDATSAEIVNAAYQAQADGVKLNGTWTLSGVITSIDEAYSETYGNITVTMLVDGADETKPIGCYRLSGTGAEELEVGYKITVTGELGYYYETVQFVQGCTLVSYEAGEIEPTLPETATPQEIVDAAYDAAETGVPMVGEYTLTGVITSIDTEYSEQYGNITVTMSVNEADKSLMCYRLSGTGVENLKVGDTITVKGTLGSYNGAPQFSAGSTLVSYVAGSGTGDGEGEITDASDNFLPVFVVLFAGCALVAAGFVGRRKMA